MYSKLIDKISSFISLEQSDLKLIETFFKFRSVARNVSLIEIGKPVDEAFFINSGYLKYSRVLETGEELIIHLFGPANFATSLNSFFLRNKSGEELQAITDCELLSISKSDLDCLYTTNPKWQGFGRRLTESFLIEKEERIIDQLSLTAQKRYLKLLESQPDIIRNVPVKYIASYIGIQPESLSRIRKTN